MDVRPLGLRQGLRTADACSDLAALAALAALLRHALNDSCIIECAAFWRIKPLSRSESGRGPCQRQTKSPQAHRRAPQQIDLFAVEPQTAIGGMPVWSGLPTETQAALTGLMTRLILEHADKNRAGSTTEAGHDL